jgi:ribulose-phosphate 3-epimerase
MACGVWRSGAFADAARSRFVIEAAYSSDFGVAPPGSFVRLLKKWKVCYNPVWESLMMDIKLSASLACANPLDYRESIAQLDQVGLDTYHFDICDGHFAPTFLLYPGLIRYIRPLTSRRFDVHLYCTHPARYLDELAGCGADVVVVHVEAREDYIRVVRQIKERGMKAGIALLPGSTVPANIVEILPEISLLIANTVGPAYAGQPFDPRGLKNMARLSQIVQDNRLDIEVAADGSVSVERLATLLGAGCTHLVCGTSSIFRDGLSLGQEFERFRRQVQTAL